MATKLGKIHFRSISKSSLKLTKYLCFHARLAIECDGDRYHGADKWEDDMRRQRILERAGWQFWRTFASTFVRNRKEVIDDLITSLTDRGIEPIGSNSVPRSIHTEQRRIVALLTNEENDDFKQKLMKNC